MACRCGSVFLAQSDHLRRLDGEPGDLLHRVPLVAGWRLLYRMEATGGFRKQFGGPLGILLAVYSRHLGGMV